nr:hypothetical protein CFP56_43378 [Quercus suber]
MWHSPGTRVLEAQVIFRPFDRRFLHSGNDMVYPHGSHLEIESLRIDFMKGLFKIQKSQTPSPLSLLHSYLPSPQLSFYSHAPLHSHSVSTLTNLHSHSVQSLSSTKFLFHSMATANTRQIDHAQLGPIDDSVLTLQTKHQSETIWNGIRGTFPVAAVVKSSPI